ncbi:MAG: hypothetical protein HFE26_04215 [Clostridia bacterium]|nr:hypothetical protein [Clostridia bacterium]
MVRYMKCPRCELNYIDAEKQDYCDVCLKEMKGIPSEADELEEAEEIATELCPICGENMMRAGEKMCDECRRKADYEAEEPDPENDEDDEWRNYLEDADDELDAEIGEIDESFEGEFEEEEPEEEEYAEEEEEDLEYVTGDEIYTLTDDEDDEDDEGEGDDF